MTTNLQILAGKIAVKAIKIQHKLKKYLLFSSLSTGIILYQSFMFSVFTGCISLLCLIPIMFLLYYVVSLQDVIDLPDKVANLETDTIEVGSSQFPNSFSGFIDDAKKFIKAANNIMELKDFIKSLVFMMNPFMIIGLSIAMVSSYVLILVAIVLTCM